MRFLLALALLMFAGGGNQVALPPVTDATPRTFTYSLLVDARTSGGVFDTEGRLVRALWSLRADSRGMHSETWDGRNELGEPAPPGAYRFKVTWNPGAYDHVGIIGNYGDTPDIEGHIPAFLANITIDREGNVYTANGWDEAGADFKKWDRNGKSVFNGRFQIRNGSPYGRAYAIGSDDTYLYCGTTSNGQDEKHHLRRFRLSDGKAVPFPGASAEKGHIRLVTGAAKQVPEAVVGRLRGLRVQPLQAIASVGDTLFVGDALNDLVYRLNRETGEVKDSFALPLVKSFAVAADGSLWVAYNRHQIGRIAEPNAEKPVVTSVRSDLGEVEAISLAGNGAIYVADSASGDVNVFSPDGKRLLRTFGQKAVPGDYAPDRYYFLRGVAADQDGSFVTIQTEQPVGSRIARFSPEGKLQWQRFCGETVSGGNYGVADPKTLYSFTFHRYELTDRAKGTNADRGNLYVPPDYHSLPRGSMRVLRFNGADFVFMPTGDGVQIYRVTPGGLRLASLVGGNFPPPNGGPGDKKRPAPQWTWSDEVGDGIPRDTDIRYFRQPKAGEWNAYETYGNHVTGDGTLYFAFKVVWKLPMRGFDKRGNPLYDWKDGKILIPRDPTPLGFEPHVIVEGASGRLFAIGTAKKWPFPKGNPFWMGSTALACYDANGTRLWVRPLPETAVGMDAIPGGGILIGGAASDTIYHYSEDGLLLGSMKPGAAGANLTTWLDNNGAISANRDPRDNRIDAFIEDDRVGRILWYRMDDSKVQSVSGPIP